MMALIVAIVHWVAHTHLSSYLRDIRWVWPLCETIHFIGLAMVVGGVASGYLKEARETGAL